MSGFCLMNCPACNQGRLRVRLALPCDRLFLLCEECGSAWAAPDDVPSEGSINHVNLSDLGFNIDSKGWSAEERAKILIATRDDIGRLGWSRYQFEAYVEGRANKS